MGQEDSTEDNKLIFRSKLQNNPVDINFTFRVALERRMFRSVFILSIFIILKIVIFAEETSDDVIDDFQHATCQINTSDVQTSANATVRRQLKGICTYKQIQRKFEELEQKLLTELNYIKDLLGNDRIVTTKTNDYYDYEEKSLNNNKVDEEILTVTEFVTHDSAIVRTEMLKLNNTMYTYKGEKVYTYYWKIPEIESILRKTGIHIRSPDFYVLGHQMCLQLYPNHLPEYLGVVLRPTSNFLKKHKFTILDQFDGSKDINSQTFGGVSSYEELYKVPYAKLQERYYLYGDVVIIKLTIFLNS